MPTNIKITRGHRGSVPCEVTAYTIASRHAQDLQNKSHAVRTASLPPNHQATSSSVNVSNKVLIYIAEDHLPIGCKAELIHQGFCRLEQLEQLEQNSTQHTVLCTTLRQYMQPHKSTLKNDSFLRLVGLEVTGKTKTMLNATPDVALLLFTSIFILLLCASPATILFPVIFGTLGAVFVVTSITLAGLTLGTKLGWFQIPGIKYVQDQITLEERQKSEAQLRQLVTTVGDTCGSNSDTGAPANASADVPCLAEHATSSQSGYNGKYFKSQQSLSSTEELSEDQASCTQSMSNRV